MTTAKHWAISATLTTPGLAFEKDGQAIVQLGGAPLSPVEYLLLSAASCMALSLKAAALALDTPLHAIRVTAAGTKPGDAPSRLSHVELLVSLTPPLARGETERLIADAQQMCTVTNTIRDAAQFAVRIDPAAIPPPAPAQPVPLTGDPA